MPSGIRLAEVVGSLSLATDLGNGQPLETALACTLEGMRLARAHGVSGKDLEAVYWGGLLRFVGCASTSVEEASFHGDDLELRGALLEVDFGDPDTVGASLARNVGRALTPAAKARVVSDFLERGPRVAPGVMRAHCEVGVRLARRLGMPESVQETLDAYHERWDAKGPRGLEGDAQPIASRVLTVAQVAVALAAGRGATAAELRDILCRRAGGQLDPALVDRWAKEKAPPRLPGAASLWDEVMAAEPGAPRTAPAGKLGELARVLGDFADLKSPFTPGHSLGVARLVTAAASALGLPDADLALVENAALLHDLGRVAVPNGIWDKAGTLNAVERERVRQHASETARILAPLGALREVARLAASDHERADGSGYPRGLAGAGLQALSRLLAAADAVHAMGEERAWRPALARERVMKLLRDEAKKGLWDPRALSAVLEAAGEDRRAAGSGWPAGLTDREVEVLRLLSRGLTNKEIGAELGISPRTVQQHTLNLYGKIGVSTRAAATLFAAEHDLFGVWRR